MDILGHHVHVHTIFETLAYVVAFHLFIFLRKRTQAPALSFEQRLAVLLGCIAGALIGSKLLAWAEWPEEFWARRFTLAAYTGGKTIVGGLLGGWIGVELAKKLSGIRASTGDAFVIPLTVGICVGRIGCFLAGLEDRTHGIETTLPWGVDFGDGVPRHPTQIYEIIFVSLLGVSLSFAKWPSGARFRAFLLAYLLFRLAVDFIKPGYALVLGMTAIQLACLLGALACIKSLLSLARTTETVSNGGSAVSLPGADQ